MKISLVRDINIQIGVLTTHRKGKNMKITIEGNSREITELVAELNDNATDKLFLGDAIRVLREKDHTTIHESSENEEKQDLKCPTLFTPGIGRIYKNHGGGEFKCIDRSLFKATATMINIRSGWTFIAHGCRIFEDGSIEWDFSTDGRFEKKPV